jgi:hypothetical protein
MADLFTVDTLSGFTGRTVDDNTWAVVHLWVRATIEAEIGTLPTPVPAGVLSVALELGKGAVPSPGGSTNVSVGPYSASFGSGGGGDGLSHTQLLRLRRAIGGGAFSIEPGPFEIGQVPARAVPNYFGPWPPYYGPYYGP